MQLHNYLHSLSKDDLIKILEQLAGAQCGVREFLLQKMALARKVDDTQQAQNIKMEESASGEHGTYVSRASSAQEKINLYKSLFVGRQDVFALRWHNAKSGKSGYSPVCANKWQAGKCDLKKYSCAVCPYKLPVKLDDNYIFNHLAGRDELCRDVIGLYPLM